MTHPLLGEVAPAAPIAADAALAAATLFTFMACIVCIGMREAWGHTIGWGLRWVAGKIRGVAISGPFGLGSYHPLAFLATALETIDHNIAHALATAALNTEKATVYLWHMTAVVFWWTTHEIADLAVDYFRGYYDLVTVTIPDAAKWARREAVRIGHAAWIREEAARHYADRRLFHLAYWVQAQAIAAYHHADHALDWSQGHVGVLERDFSGLRARIRHIERMLTKAGFIGLVIAALGSLGLGALRCPGFTRLLRKHGCGLGGLLEGLIGLAISALALENVCRMLPILEAAFGEVIGPVIHLLTEVPLGGCEKPPKGWARLAVEVGPLPPPQTLGALPV